MYFWTKLIIKGHKKYILDKKEKNYLVPIATRILTIYYLPKVHKDPIHPPNHPIISGIDSVTARIGGYIVFYLQPIVKKVPSFLKDTKDVIKLLSEINVEEGVLLATVNVTFLYTCISHEFDYEAVSYFLSKQNILQNQN